MIINRTTCSGVLGTLVFISPCKTSAVDSNEVPVQKLRTNLSLPGMMVLGSLNVAGFESHFLDLTTEGWDCQRMAGKHLLAYGLSSRDTVERIAEMKASHVLITSMFSFEYMMVDELVREIKRTLLDVTVILGGIHASVKPEWHFEESGPDFIVIGEGEKTVVELLVELSKPSPDPNKVSGIAFRDNCGHIIRTADRELLYDLEQPWELEKILRRSDGSMRYVERMTRKSPEYVDNKVGEDVYSATLFGSRGCPRACKYCTATKRTGREIRHMGAHKMFDYFLTLRQQYGVSVFCNQADTFGLCQEDLEFSRMVKEYRSSTGDISFVINNPNAFFLEQMFTGSDNRQVNREFLHLLKDIGFNIVTIAIETLNQRFNGKVNWKSIQPEMVMELCQSIQDIGLKTDIYMMYGFPGQSKKEFDKDLKFGEQLMSHVDLITWNSLSLLPGTRYYEEYVEKQGKEDAYRQMIKDGYGCYFVREEFNLSEVSGQYYKDSLEEFGKSWI